jgi:hypothetical protein
MVLATVALIGLASSPGTPVDTFCTQQAMWSSDRDALGEWSVYRSSEYRFEIMYPPGWTVAETPDTLVACDAVVTFAPAYDPSISEGGVKTNLITASVTVAVSDVSGALGRQGRHGARSDLPKAVCILNPQRMGFVRTVSSEGAVGNRYETSTLATSFAGRRYEISLFVHSANPGCYSVGSITVFDSVKVERLFETMASTFLLTGGSSRCRVE